jgi:hypothetical protein
MEAEAIGTRSKDENIFCQSGPNSVDMTFWPCQSKQMNSKKAPHLHLPIWHIVCVSLHLLEHLLNLGR